ncbi:MAG: hypothetical protein BWY73_01438 [candidate division TA06 bacterium ADurb.Bin417]|uniref:HEAT repeat protein n=1 Tax=candidate division TA06 bacterium ADurb.Bin417 TaxID=1852828 RepID=A0A1V5M9B9_UNCT6|nr:MAG: hypothetical protein BWY73_01438 [candidate division TA06 bacterium ADurb.Bin417]
MDQIVDELVRAAFNNQDKLAVRETAVESLSLIFHPKALNAVDRAISGSTFPVTSRFKFLVALKQQNTSDAYRIILKYWVIKEWPPDPETFPMDIMRKEWPSELGDSIMEQMNKLLGKDEMLAVLMSSWPGGVETTYKTVPDGLKDYVAYYALMVGQLGGREAATLLVQRLKEDYPLVQPAAGAVSSIVRPGMDPYAPGPGGVPSEGPSGNEPAPAVVSEAVLKEEIRFRVEAVKVLSIIAGENLLPFLQYLAKNDIKPEVRTMASSILGTVETRIAASRDDLRQAASALAANRFDEAIRLYKQAYEKNPSPRVTREYEKSKLIIGAQYLAGNRKAEAEPLLKPLFDALEVKVYQKLPEEMVKAKMTPEKQQVMAQVEAKKQAVIDDIKAKLSANGLTQAEIQRADPNRFFNYGIEKGWLVEEATLMEMPPGEPGGPMPGQPGYGQGGMMPAPAP